MYALIEHLLFYFAVISNSFLINPDSKTEMEGTTLNLFCVNSGSLPAATISWTKDSEALSDSNSRITITSGTLNHVDPPQTTSSLFIDPLVTSDSGNYACVAMNSLLPNEAVYSSDAVVTVLGKATTHKENRLNVLAVKVIVLKKSTCTSLEFINVHISLYSV